MKNAASPADGSDLSAEQWLILAQLGDIYRRQGHHDEARRAYAQAAYIISYIADQITDQNLRNGFLQATYVQEIISQTKTS